MRAQALGLTRSKQAGTADLHGTHIKSHKPLPSAGAFPLFPLL